MPKDPSGHVPVSRRAHNTSCHPYFSYDKGAPQSRTSKDVEDSPPNVEWNDARCPICIEHPHNAILLLCSSYEKGCRPFMCDTSYRHSNCLDQYRKAQPSCEMDSTSSLQRYIDASVRGEISPITSGRTYRGASGDTGRSMVGLQCPLCRGKVKGYKVIQTARSYLNRKARSCAQDGCPFVGTYEELRKHARGVHPSARPAYVDPDRQLAWQQMEHQHDIDDILSTIQSAMPRAVVIGDYVIDGGDGSVLDREDRRNYLGSSENWWSAFLLFHVLSPLASLEVRRTPASWSASRRHQHSAGMLAMPRLFWGENLLDIEERSTESRQTGDPVTNGGMGLRRRRHSGQGRSGNE